MKNQVSLSFWLLDPLNGVQYMAETHLRSGKILLNGDSEAAFAVMELRAEIASARVSIHPGNMPVCY